MARTRAQSATEKGHPSPVSKDQENPPTAVETHRATRTTPPHPKPSPGRASGRQPNKSPSEKILSQQSLATPDKHGRKRCVEAIAPESGSSQKRPRQPHGLSQVDPMHPVEFWARKGQWPQEYSGFDWQNTFARKRSISYPSEQSKSAVASTPIDQRPRAEKSAPYRNAVYEIWLKRKNSFMGQSDVDITDINKGLIKDLLDNKQIIPSGTIFDDEVFMEACAKLRDKNEARVIQDLSRLLVPSAETLALHDQNLKHLVESVNEGWNNSVPLTGTRPQPDYSVGFSRKAFTADQLAKLSPSLGDFLVGDKSFFMSTDYMYFPFLTCEVQCGLVGLDVADRQNAHSMTLAVRAFVELFRAVKRGVEAHRQILGFSISHNARTVRIFGHYPIVDERSVKYYRHPIRAFDFTDDDGKNKWAAYQFVKNIYEVWVPDHLKNICSAIDQLPSALQFEVHPLPKADLS